MNNKRVTIYDIAKELGISASYISKALNNHPTISEKVRETVKKKALELNYKQNSHAANLRQGSSKTIGVIVPHINQSFFSEAIAGIEEVCFEHNHGLIICQSHEFFKQECKAIDTLIHQNVDCILISVSAETLSASHLETIKKNRIQLIQFDRCIDTLDSYKVLNDNKEASYSVVKNLIKEAGLIIPYNYIVDDVLYSKKASEAAEEILSLKEPPDAFFTVSDHQSLEVFKIAESMGIMIPEQLGIFGFANEDFGEIIKPALSSVDQRSKELGKQAANLYFKKIRNKNEDHPTDKNIIIESQIIIRQSSIRTSVQ